jgi:mono/diheme cytochrome c family protein
MRLLYITIAIAFLGCKSTKKTSTSTSSSTETKATTASVSKTGIIEPGIDQLTAIQLKNKDVTADNLKNGYAIYTGACTNCHGAKSIYSRSNEKWPSIIEDMAKKSKLNQQQKDDLTNYIFAIKATQPASK